MIYRVKHVLSMLLKFFLGTKSHGTQKSFQYILKLLNSLFLCSTLSCMHAFLLFLTLHQFIYGIIVKGLKKVRNPINLTVYYLYMQYTIRCKIIMQSQLFFAAEMSIKDYLLTLKTYISCAEKNSSKEALHFIIKYTVKLLEQIDFKTNVS